MFKKTVSMHEVFLQRLAAHPVFRTDNNFRVFLEYKEDVSDTLENNERISSPCFAVECSKQKRQRTYQRLLQNVDQNGR